jgi:hypothetical protein
MKEAEDIFVEVGDDGSITVRLRGTSMKAVYTRSKSPWPMLADFTDDRDAPIKITQFRVLAWSAATKKARELGWIA